jgi:hypothetical protein
MKLNDITPEHMFNQSDSKKVCLIIGALLLIASAIITYNVGLDGRALLVFALSMVISAIGWS